MEGLVKRKYRWLFEGFNQDGKIAFPQSYVKINDRPSFPYMLIADGKEIYLPGEISITLWSIDEDDEEELKVVNWQDVIEANLALTDGCGKFLETWDFAGVQMELLASDEVAVEWKLSYKQADWEVLNDVIGGRPP